MSPFPACGLGEFSAGAARAARRAVPTRGALAKLWPWGSSGTSRSCSRPARPGCPSAWPRAWSWRAGCRWPTAACTRCSPTSRRSSICSRSSAGPRRSSTGRGAHGVEVRRAFATGLLANGAFALAAFALCLALPRAAVARVSRRRVCARAFLIAAATAPLLTLGDLLRGVARALDRFDLHNQFGSAAVGLDPGAGWSSRCRSAAVRSKPRWSRTCSCRPRSWRSSARASPRSPAWSGGSICARRSRASPTAAVMYCRTC